MTAPHHTLYPISSKSICVAVVLVWFTASHMWRPQPFSAFVQTVLPFSGFAVEPNEQSFNEWSFVQRSRAFADGEVVFWSSQDDYPLLLDRIQDLDRVTRPGNEMKVWSDTTREMVLDERICVAAKSFKEAGSVKRHVLLTHFNENWGAFSGYVKNRTANWGSMLSTFGQCSFKEAMEYLDHNNTLAIVTTQFQQLEHPKVFSIPLGVMPDLHNLPKNFLVDRTQLLMINSSPTRIRQPQIDMVIENFNFTINNTYGRGDYVEELQRSKFILSPAGMGWDCYRIWEAFAYGSVPVIEHYNRPDGWRRSLDGLPVVWVAHFREVTPELLEAEYTRLSQLRNYTFEKLTSRYWLDFIQKLRAKQ